ncbi:MAG: hypothetical protein JMN24_09625 [gamma proteobacterium endosymbiont of Lamellibrachia anaximandri]|nr:hypothetical protein [gamma proteobacterium endosymbiont of Lamellibrachia anaximandri]MBL3617823.1 hypothetical protein [gamma proteobacterium endosymbiont of Lamellibrachia anaximandri]
MPNRIAISIVISISLLLTGCSTLLKPSNEALAKLPVIKLGQPVPKDGDYILHLSKEQPVLLDVTVEGSLFAEAAHQVLPVFLAKDLYLHKDWASNDKKHWHAEDDLITGELRIEITDYQLPTNSRFHLRMDYRTPE